jgi:hypothetical protein
MKIEVDRPAIRRLRKLLVRGAIVILFFWTPPERVNPASRLSLVESLLSRGTAATEGSPFFNRVDMVFVDGHFYSDKPPLLALYSTAVLLPFHKLVGFDRPGRQVLYLLVVLTSSGLALVVMFLLLRALRCRLALSQLSMKWLAVAALGATCVLPFGRTYNDHIIEASLIFGVFVLLLRFRDSPSLLLPLAVGGLIGVTGLLHPLTGFVFLATTALYFLTAGRGAAMRLRATVYFLTAASVTGLAGTGVHQLVYDTPIPFYFSPETYLWTDGPADSESAWMQDPAPPGLTAELITERFAELGIPDEELEQTLASFTEYRQSVRNPLTFASRRFFTYDQLSLDPLIMFCLFLMVANLARKGFSHRPEWMWVLLGLVGMYAATTWLRAVPGASFGNRHLLPILPVIVLCGAAGLTSVADHGLFKGLTLLSLAMMIPGMAGPWTTPWVPFLTLNLAVSGAALLCIAWYFGSARGHALAERAYGRLQAAGATPVAIAFVLWTLVELGLYLPSLGFRL